MPEQTGWNRKRPGGDLSQWKAMALGSSPVLPSGRLAEWHAVNLEVKQGSERKDPRCRVSQDQNQ